MKRFLCILVLLNLAFPARAQVPGPPLPDKYRAVIRYHIVAPRDVHVVQYDAMIEHLKSLDFTFDPPLDQLPSTSREDRTTNQITGLVAGKNAVKILQNPSVASMLLVPEDFKLPDQPDGQVHVRLEINSGIPEQRQRELGDQVRVILGLLGFKEAGGYDNHGYSKKPYSRIVGFIPASQLDLLLRDLRYQPTGWLSPVIPSADVPSPLRQANPLLITEVLPDPEPVKDVYLEGTRKPAYLEKISPDLWSVVKQKEQEYQTVRLQILLMGSPDPGDKDLRFLLVNAAPSLVIDGWLGPVLTGSVLAGHVPALAALTEVSALRLVRTVNVQVDPRTKFAADNARALQLSGLADLHGKGFRGKGVRLAILDSDFRGWDKNLPAGTHFVDLTAERDPDLLPAPVVGDADKVGHGTQCALAALLAAPEAELFLIRREGADPYQVYEMAQYCRGNYLSESMQRRRDEILAYRSALRNRREELLKERRKILENFTDDRELERDFGFLGPVMGWIFSDRQLHYQHMTYQERLEKDLSDRSGRFGNLVENVAALRGMQIVASSLNWQEGQAVGSASTLSRWLATAQLATKNDRRQAKPPLWFQAAGNTRGQAWAGYFHDRDGNGFLEFAPPQTPIPKGRWSRELNFLGWQTYEGESLPDLPAEARVRVSLQWREPHDPDYFTQPGEDFYLQPLAAMQVQVLRQRDPDLKILPADAFDVVGRSSRLPQRLEHHPGYSLYEHQVEFTVEKAGRFALQVERVLPTRWVLADDGKRPGFAYLQEQVPTGLRPRGVATLTPLEKNWEMRARLFVEVVDDKTRPLGRTVLADYFTDQGSLGVPADARGVLTVGAADFAGKPLPSSAMGPPAFLDLADKPDLLAYAGLQVVPPGNGTAFGTSLATPFAAGWAACLISSKMSPEQITQLIHTQSGKVIQPPRKK